MGWIAILTGSPATALGYVLGFVFSLGATAFPVSFIVIVWAFLAARLRKYDADDEELARSNVLGIAGIIVLFVSYFGLRAVGILLALAPNTKPPVLSSASDIVAIAVCLAVALAALLLTRKVESKGLQLGLLAANFGILFASWTGMLPPISF